MLSIVTAPSPVLTTPTKPIITIDKSVKKLIREMEETLLAQKDPEGVGLAAPQVGRPLALFIIKKNANSQTRTFINPQIIGTLPTLKPTAQDQKKALNRMEGCLSIPHIWAPLIRPQEVTLSYMTPDGQTHQERFEGFDAVIVQHEVDHLNGVLFTSRCLEHKVQLYEEQGGELYKVRV